MKSVNHAGVWFPPALIYIIPLLGAAAIHSQHAWPITTAQGTAVPVAGMLAIGAGIVIGLASVFSFNRAGTTILPAGAPTTAIVASGPYRFTRNPMYLAMASACFGLALLLNNAWALFVLPMVLVLIDRTVIRREERYLTAAFGQQYVDYCAQVRRWV